MELWRAEPGDVLRLPSSCWPRTVTVTDAEATALRGEWVRIDWETDEARGSTVFPDALDADLLHTERAGKAPFLAPGAEWSELAEAGPVTPKTPTPQGISALLKRAGFERSVSSATRIKGWRNYSEGYSVAKWDDYGSVEVTWHRGLRSQSEADEIRPRVLADYIEAIRAGGYSVSTAVGDRLIVTEGKADR